MTRRKTSIFIYFFTELKIYHLSYFYLNLYHQCISLWGFFLWISPTLQNSNDIASHLPSFVINHGVVTPMEVQQLLNESMVSIFSFFLSSYLRCVRRIPDKKVWERNYSHNSFLSHESSIEQQRKPELLLYHLLLIYWLFVVVVFERRVVFIVVNVFLKWRLSF